MPLVTDAFVSRVLTVNFLPEPYLFTRLIRHHACFHGAFVVLGSSK